MPLGLPLPAVRIEDAAQLEHRGLLLTAVVTTTPDFVKRIVDVLALQKMNVLHWHLTEDQGWRIPSKPTPN